MEKLKLSVSERFALTNLLSAISQKGGMDLGSLRKAINIVGKVEITAKEATQIQLKQEGSNVTWAPTKAKDIEVEFNQDEGNLIRDAIKKKSEEKAFTLADRNILTLADKLELKL